MNKVKHQITKQQGGDGRNFFKEAFGFKARWRGYVTDDGRELSADELSQLRIGKTLAGVTLAFDVSNIVPTVGREAIAKALAAQIASEAEIAINYQELGTGVTAPANGDTGLETPDGSTRKVISSLGYSANLLTITAFWAAGEATGTWREFATFINGTGASNSGVIFNHVAINVTVGASNALTIDGEVTIN